MPNRYNDQDYPRYYERSDRYNSRSSGGEQNRYDQNQQRNRSGSGRESAQGGSSDYDRNEQSGYYGAGNNRDAGGNQGFAGRGSQSGGRGYDSANRQFDDFASSSRHSGNYTGDYNRSTGSDRGDYTLYGYDRDSQYADRSGDQGGYGERTSDYNRNFGYSGGAGNYGRSDDRDQQDREHGGSSRYYGNQSGRTSYGNQENSQSSYGQSGSYTGSSESGFDYNRRDQTQNRARNEQEERNWWDRTTDQVSSWFGDEDATRRRERDARESDYSRSQSRDQGAHRGRGPKNYRRSDDRIKDDVNDRLTDYAYLDASDIDVQVSNGEVTLTGTVDSRYAKRMAEDLAENVSGVTHVENRLRVNQQNQQSTQNQAGFSSTGATDSSGTYGSREDLAANYSQNATDTSVVATTNVSQMSGSSGGFMTGFGGGTPDTTLSKSAIDPDATSGSGGSLAAGAGSGSTSNTTDSSTTGNKS